VQWTVDAPKEKSWGRLDANITGPRDGLGITVLATFKPADIGVGDVPWFFGWASERYLEELGRPLSVPKCADAQAIGIVGTG
jgi:hypothetical protein